MSPWGWGGGCKIGTVWSSTKGDLLLILLLNKAIIDKYEVHYLVFYLPLVAFFSWEVSKRVVRLLLFLECVSAR